MDQSKASELYIRCSVLVNNGQSNQYILDNLMADGLSLDEAKEILIYTINSRRERFDKEGWKLVMIGMILLLVGVVATLISYSMASDNGGKYWIMSGIILVGVINLVRGIAMFFKD